MPFPMRIQPIDSIRYDIVKPKSRLKRLFDRPFNGVLKHSSTTDKPNAAGGEKDGGVFEFEPSSVCLDKMVRNFMEESNNDKHTVPVKCGRRRCNCFNGNSNDSSDDELDFFSDSLTPNSSFGDPSDTLKTLIPCVSMMERTLLADTSKIVEKNNKSCKRKEDLRKIVTDCLISLGYNASICKSKWEKSDSIPAGDYEYIDVITEEERVLIDVDFRSEFEIARSTSSYKSILQLLPSLFVGKSDRILQIVSIAAEAARLSLKKKGMHIAPWRKSEYMKSKWLAPHNRITPKLTFKNDIVHEKTPWPGCKPEKNFKPEKEMEFEVGELDLIFGEDTISTSSELESDIEKLALSPEKKFSPVMTWQLPAVRPRSFERGNKIVVTGLAALLKEKL